MSSKEEDKISKQGIILDEKGENLRDLGFATILENIHEGVIIADKSGKVKYSNTRASLYLGEGNHVSSDITKRAEQIGIYNPGSSQIIQPEELPMMKAMKGVETYNKIFFVQNESLPEGAYLKTFGKPIYNSRGELHGGIVSFYDITEHVKSKEKEEQKKNFYMSITNHMSEGLVQFDQHGHIQLVNNSFLKKLGYREDELIGSHPYDLELFNREDVPAILQQEQERESSTSDHSIRKIKNRDGVPLYFHVIAQPILDEYGQFYGSLAILSDVTQKIEAEEKLKESEQNYRNLVERMNDGVLYTNVKGEVQFCNESFKQLTGLNEEKLHAKSLKDALSIRNISHEAFGEKLQRRLNGESEIYDILFKDDTGNDKWLRVSASPVMGDQNEVLGVLGLFTDITKEKQTTEENQRLRALVESTPDYVGIADREGQPLFLNNAARELLGIAPNDHIEDFQVSEHVFLRDPSVYDEEIVPQLKQQGHWQGEVTLIDKDGTLIPVSMVMLTEKDERGKIRYISTVARDISETRNLARIAELNPGPILRVTPEGVIQYANPASETLLKQWTTRQGDFLPPDWLQEITQTVKEGKMREYEINCGKTIYDLKVVPISEQGVVNFIGTNITKRKQAEQLLRDSEEKYRTVVEDQTEMICRFRKDGSITFANDAYARHFAKEKEQVIGANVLHEFDNYERKDFQQHLSVLSKEHPVSSYERKYVDQTGQHHWQLWLNRAIYGHSGNFIEYQAVGRDITDLKDAQFALDRQKSFLRSVIDANPNIIYVTNKDNCITLVNKAFEQEYNVTAKDVEREKIHKVIQSKWHDDNMIDYEDVLQQGEPIIQEEKPLIDKVSGDQRWFHIIKSPIFSETNLGNHQILTIAIDITERKQAEEALRKQLRLEELISSISREFINADVNGIDQSIDKALEQICLETGFEYGLISTVRGNNIHFERIYQKPTVKGIDTDLLNQGFSLSSFRWVNKQLRDKGLIYIPSRNSMPAEAKEEQQILESLGFQSTVTIPLYIKNEFVGFLSFCSSEGEFHWSNESLWLFSIAGQVFSNALERKNTETQLNYKIEFENLITQISTEFITISIDEIDEAIHEALHKVAETLGVEVGILFTNDGNNKTFSLSHLYHQVHENIDITPFQNIPLDEYQFSFKQLEANNFFAYEDISNIPQEGAPERSFAGSLDIRSLIILPMRFHNNLIGSLVFGSSDKKKFWTDSSKPLLNIVSQILANTLKRKKVELSLRESQELYRTLASNIPHSTVFLFDETLHYNVVEGASLEGIGMDKQQIQGQHVKKVFPYDLAERLTPLHEAALKGEENVIEHTFSNQTHYFIHLLPVASKKGESFGGMLIFLDVSELKNAQLKLERQKDELKRSNAELEMFAYAASHDLREPLRMVNSYVKLIQKRLGGKADEDLQDFMNFAVDGVDRMQELINDLLEYSRVDRKGKPFREVDTRQVVEVAKKNLEQSIAESDATIRAEDLPNILGDQSQLVSLFQNLINNAVKFRQERPLTVTISVDDQTNYWLFSVEDNGMGIEKKHFGRIFNIFQRLHSRKNYEGTGVGLAICKKITERHGGDIWVESQPGQGTTFYFTIPK